MSALTQMLCYGQTPQLVHDLSASPQGSTPTMFSVFNEKLYFCANTPEHGREIFVYDGSNPPSLLFNINPGAASSQPGLIGANTAILNGKFYFAANDGTHGVELFEYDGTNPPSLVADISSGAFNGSPRNFHVYNGKVYFSSATDFGGFELCIYEGVNAIVIIDVNPGSLSGSTGPIISYKDKIYFQGTNGLIGESEFMIFDPITNTVSLVSDINVGTVGSYPENFIIHNDILYFAATTNSHGKELYSYNGTSVVRLTDVSSGTGNGVKAEPKNLFAYNDFIYFSGSVNGSDYQLYRYNPANNTAQLAFKINNSGSASIEGFTNYAGKLYFVANDGVNGRELWVHDGTNTSIVFNLNPAAGSGADFDLIVYNDLLYFSGNDGNSGFELYSFKDANVGIQNTAFNTTLTIAPNPTTTNATLIIDLMQNQSLSIQLLDASGKVIWQDSKNEYLAGSNHINLPLSTQASGMYVYVIKDENGRFLASGKVLRN